MITTLSYPANEGSAFVIPHRTPPRNRRFPDTRWGTVERMNSRCSSEEDSLRAFNELCKMYWYPIYAYIRRDMGKSKHDAEDLTQGYFTMVVEKNLFSQIDHRKGKLRTFVCLSVKRFVIDRSRCDHSKKRGEGYTKISLDIDDAEERISFENYGALSPSQAFDRRYLMSVFEEIFAEIESSYRKRGEIEVYRAITPYFVWGRQDQPQAAVAEALGMSVGALRMRISRVREMIESRLRSHILRTVNSEREVDEEIAHYRKIASTC